MIAQIQMRRGTTAEWTAASPVVLAAGEPGWDSTLKGMKVGDGATEWAALPWIDAKNRPNINADTLDGVHLADIRLGRNILHNWDFRNPVNQRGVSGTQSSSAGYFYDRWIQGGNVYVTTGYVSLDAGEYIEQRIEEIVLAGQTCTLTYLNYASNYIIYTGVFPETAGTYNDYTDSGVTIRFGHGTTYMYIRIIGVAASAIAIRRVKLELGTVSTLHLDPPMDHAVELPKCMRFFMRLKSQKLTGYTDGTGSAGLFFLALPTIMRIPPTVLPTPQSVSIYDGSTTFKTVTLTTEAATESGIILMGSGTGLNSRHPAASYTNMNIDLTADL